MRRVTSTAMCKQPKQIQVSLDDGRFLIIFLSAQGGIPHRRSTLDMLRTLRPRTSVSCPVPSRPAPTPPRPASVIISADLTEEEWVAEDERDLWS
jgi:hypothetical protein